MENNMDRKTGRLEKWIPFLLFALVTAIYSFRFFEPGKMIYGSDLTLTGQYFERFVHELVAKGDFPFWNPYIYSGVPYFASLGSEMFYPTYFIYHLFNLPPHVFFLCEYILCIFLSGSFMYIYARSLGLTETSSFLAGIFFMFSGNIITLINAGHIINMQAMVYIPMIFYFFDKGIQKEKIIYFLIASCFFGLQCSSAAFQIMAYTVAMVFMYLVFKIVFEKRPVKLLGYFLLTVIMVPLISAVQFIPANYYNKLSYRAAPTYEYFTSWSIHPTETISFLLPRFFGLMESTYWGHNPFYLTSEYIGILPIILAFTAGFFLIRDKRVLCFTILAVITLLFSFGGYTPIAKILYHFPIISKFRTSARWLVFFTFSIVILAGIGFDFLINFITQKYKKENFTQFRAFKIILTVLSVCFAAGWLFVYLNSTMMPLKMQSWELIKNRFGYQNTPYVANILYKMIAGDMLRLAVFFSTGTVFILLAFYGKINKYLLTGCLAILLMIDMGYIGLQSVKTAPINEMTIREAETLDFLQQDNSLYRVFPIDGFSSDNWFVGSKIQSIKGYTISLNDYHEAMNNGAFNSTNLLNLLNVKYILTTRSIDHPLLKLVFDKNIKIYQNSAVLPRAFLFNKVEVNKQKYDYMNKIMSPDFNLKEKLIINEDFEEKLDTVSFNGDEINITAYHPNYITLDVKNPGNSVLFLSEMYYPEWKALVDGKETRIYKANGLFRAIYLTKGDHHIKFYYSPKMLYEGLIISFLTIISILIFGIFYYRSSKSALDKGQA